MTELKTPSGGGGPHTLIITDDQSTIWFTMQSGNKVASLDTKTGAIKEYPSSGWTVRSGARQGGQRLVLPHGRRQDGQARPEDAGR